MPIIHDHYLIVPNKELHKVYESSAVKKPIALKHAQSQANKTNKIMVIVRVTEIVLPAKKECPHINTIDQGPDGVLCTDCGETICK